MGSEVSVSLHLAIQATRPPAPTASGLSPYSHHLPYPGHAYRIDFRYPKDVIGLAVDLTDRARWK